MSDTENTAAETVRAILDRGRAADDLGKLCRRLRLAPDEIEAIADAVRHCPRGIAAIGRVLAHGGQARAVVGPSDDQDATRHLEHARDHLLSALAYPDAATDHGTDTGELESAHAGARCALAVEIVERGRR